MFLFIFESIGMTELFFIGVVALIVFGPRKLPQMARTIGKAMAEFRKATSDFKETWEKEVDFEEFKDEGKIKPILAIDNSISKVDEKQPDQIALPEISEINQADFEKRIQPKEVEKSKRNQGIKGLTEKQDWL